MSRWTILVLVALVAGLGFLAWRQTQRDAAYTQEAQVALFEGWNEARVTALRLEVVQRDVQARFERDPKGGWIMTDPVRVRAEAGVLDPLVRSVLARTGTPVPEQDADPAKLGLEPPRMVLELLAADGARQRIEVGALDLDGQRVHVRARGRVLRTLRDFETLLDSNLDQFKSHAATTIDARDVVEWHRRGRVWRPDDTAPVDVAMDAVIDGDRWRVTSPVLALLDPLQMSLLCGATAGLRFEEYVETGGSGPAGMGLDPPELRIELASLDGRKAALLFGRPDAKRPNRWVGMLEGETNVWRVPDGLVFDLAAPVEDFLDHRVHRVPVADVDRIQLSTTEHEVLLQKGLLGWVVSQARAGSDTFDKPILADKRKVDDFLAKLERVEIRAFLRGATFDPAERRATLRLSARGAGVEVAFGREHDAGGVRLLRDGDGLVGVIDDSVFELVRTPAGGFWSSSVYDLDEVTTTRLELTRGDRTRTYERNRGTWTESGRTNEARELTTVLDPLVFLRAARHLDSLAPPPEDPIRVRWTLASGVEKVLVIGRVPVDGTPTVVCDHEGRRSVLERQDLHDALSAIVSAASGAERPNGGK